MNKEIETKYVFIDTSIFVKENFFAGNRLKAFFKHNEESNIILLITDITINESIRKLSEYFNQSKNVLKKAIDNIDNKAKTLKNIKSLSSIFNLKYTLDFAKEKELLMNNFEKLITNNFKIIDIDPNKTNKIITDYFNFNPPFKDGKKKFEFPDAYVINSLESWCKENNEKIYIVSTDEDMNTYKSDFLVISSEYDKLLEQISFTYSEENISQKIKKIIDDNDSEILTEIENDFEVDFPTSGVDNYKGFDYDVDYLTINNSNIESYSVLQITGNLAEIELSVNLDYVADVTYKDTDTGYYDKEESKWYGVINIVKQVSDYCDLSVIIQVEVNLLRKNNEKGWKFIEITNGVPFDISLDI